jgi:hypothetical protein
MIWIARGLTNVRWINAVYTCNESRWVWTDVSQLSSVSRRWILANLKRKLQSFIVRIFNFNRLRDNKWTQKPRYSFRTFPKSAEAGCNESNITRPIKILPQYLPKEETLLSPLHDFYFLLSVQEMVIMRYPVILLGAFEHSGRHFEGNQSPDTSKWDIDYLYLLGPTE